MNARLALAVLLIPLAATCAAASVEAAGKPAVTITSPANDATLHGGTLRVAVTVSNFRLVPTEKPVKGQAGDILYQLDGHYVRGRDWTSATTHTWTGVQPGRHTLTVSLTTPQGLPFPSAQSRSVSVTLVKPAPKPVHHSSPVHAGGGSSPSIGAAPTTGGGAGAAGGAAGITNILTDSEQLGLLLAGVLAIIIGFALLGRHVVFAGGPDSGGETFASGETSAGAAPVDIPSADPLPAEGPGFDVMANAETETPVTLAVEPEFEPVTEPQPEVEARERAAADLPAPLPPGTGAEAPPVEEQQPAMEPTPEPTPAMNPVIPFPAAAQTEAERREEAVAVEEAAATPEEAVGTPVVEESEIAPEVQPDLPAVTAGETMVPTGILALRRQTQAVTQQWNEVLETLLHQIEAQEAERKRMLDHIRTLEQRLQSTQSIRRQLQENAASGITSEELQSIRQVTESLLRDPDHIVVLAAVAQNAAKLHRLVESYARLRQSMEEE